jgi:hypothetical protein
MTDVILHEAIPLPAEAVWEVIGDFGNISKWAPIVQGTVLEETPGGTVRALTMGDDNVVREIRVGASQFSYSYSMVDRPELPDYRSVVAVIPLDGSNCRIFLEVHVTATSTLTDEEITDRYTKFLRGNLKAMKRAIGGG